MGCSMIPDLKCRFKKIKKYLFPRWDGNHEWKVTNNNEKICEIENSLKTDFLGFCDKKSKTIYLNLDENDWKIEMLIVHEICHTFRNCGTHGKLWKNKMNRVSNRCDRLKYYDLADQIRHEIENYENS